MNKKFGLNKYLLIFVILANFFISTKVNAGCTSSLVTVCFHEHGNSSGNRYCWKKAAGLDRFEVQYVGDAVNNDASSVSMSPNTNNLYICSNSNLNNCHLVNGNEKSFFGNMSPNQNDQMSSWKLECSD